MPEVVLDPPRYVDAKPTQKVERSHGPAHGKGEHDGHRRSSALGALIVVVGDEVLGCVEVVDHLSDEESATFVLLREQPQMLVMSATVALRNRNPADR